MLGTILQLLSNSSNSTNSTHNVTQILTAQTPGTSLLFSGVEQFLFPFLLVFAIVYGVLERSKIFEGKRDVESIIAFVLGIVFATTSYTLQLTYIILPIAGIVAVVVFMLLAIASMVYGQSSEFPPSIKKTIVVVAIIISFILILWVLTNFQFAGFKTSDVIGVLENYAPYIAVIMFLLIAGYLLSK